MKILSQNLKFSNILAEYKKSEVFLIRLPELSLNRAIRSKNGLDHSKLYKICQIANQFTSSEVTNNTIAFIGPMELLPYIYHSVNHRFIFRYLVALQMNKTNSRKNFLPNEHLGLIIFSNKKNQKFFVVKNPYRLCKSCGNTEKDYGGKKHLLNADGTTISDVWTGFSIDSKKIFPDNMIARIQDLVLSNRKNRIAGISFLKSNKYLTWKLPDFESEIIQNITPTKKSLPINLKLQKNVIYNNDVFDGLKQIPDNSVDLALIDPPYNLSIRYGRFGDDKNENDYIRWMKSWIDEVCRTIKKNGRLFLVNIPKWSLEIFPYLEQRMFFQGWIVWSAWSVPRGSMIPAHYPILCFSKGNTTKPLYSPPFVFSNKENTEIFYPMNLGYCIRATCINHRTVKMQRDRHKLTDIWNDIHRIRHNSFRYNHPTLMPQKLAKRIIMQFSKKNDLILDCFNGVGTTTLTSQILERNYIGIEKNLSYFKTSQDRHSILTAGGDPFERKDAKSTSDVKGYRKIKPQTQVAKYDLQMEVKHVAERLGHCPSKHELDEFGKYPLKIYFDNFHDWAEITVATRRTGINKKSSI